MTEKLEIMEKRFDEINEKLTDINVINDQEQYKNLMKELKSLTPMLSNGSIIPSRAYLRAMCFLL